MLELLRIQNLAVIDEAQVEFKKGLNILSGETGAGKSIVLEAIVLLLGARASSDSIRSGAEEAMVEGLFDLSRSPLHLKKIEELGFSVTDQELILRRILHKSGKNRVYVNGSLASLSALQEITEGLVDLCSQHEQQSLFKQSYQMELLDQYSSIEKESTLLREGWKNWKNLKKEKEVLVSGQEERLKRGSFLQFQIDEIEAAEIEAGEEERLQSEKRKAQKNEAAKGTLAELTELFEGNEGGVFSTLQKIQKRIRELTKIDESYAEWDLKTETAYTELGSVSLSVHQALDGFSRDGFEQEHVAERLAKLLELKRKYGSPLFENPSLLVSKLKEEVETLGKAEAEIEELEGQIASLGKSLETQSKKVSLARRKNAPLISKEISQELAELHMQGAKVEFKIETRVEDPNEWTETGLGDELAVFAQTNLGEEPKLIQKIASGGEISRIMLALRRVVSDRGGGIGVYLFDEVDAGVGGKTAFSLGRKLQSVAKHSQVICITHVPQVAAFADHHLSLQKKTVKGRTKTEIVSLKKEERREEIARMLGGPKLTKSSLENARELLDLAKH